MIRNLLLTLAIACAAMTSAAQGAGKAEKKIALVFGNSAYVSVPSLRNPKNDSAAMASMLQKAGFDVTAKQDAGVAEMRKLLRDFSAKVNGADEVVVFYAGHGIEVDGTNYLVPIDASLERDVDVEDEAVSLDRIVRLIEPAKRLRLIILDACRDNPFGAKMTRSLSRSVTRGLAKVEPSSPNTLIAYAAKAGSTAADGDGANGVFTTALLKQLPVPGQDLRKSLGYVRDDVLKATDSKQEPYVYGSLGGDDVTIVAGPAKAADLPPQIASLDPNSRLRRDYELAGQVNTIDGWDAFLRSYPKGFYADLARAARSKLQGPAISADARNLSGIDKAPTDDPGIARYAGKSFRVSYAVRQVQAAPEEGKIGRVPREIAFYVASPTEIRSRFTDRPNSPKDPGSRFAGSVPGGVSRGIQIIYDERHFLMTVEFSTYRLKAIIRPAGNTCTAQIEFELRPGETAYKQFRSNATHDPMLFSTMTAEQVICWMTPTDEVGQPPAAAAQPQ